MVARESKYFSLSLESLRAVGSWAIENVTDEVREVLLQMPARKIGKSRLGKILYELDEGIRGRALPENT